MRFHARDDRAAPWLWRGRRRRKSSLLREIPRTVALLAVREDFTAMRRYPSFTFHDHRSYLRHMERTLRDLVGQGTHITVTRFDPAAYAAFCSAAALDADSPASRSRYTAQVAPAAGSLPYDGASLYRFLPRLLGAVARRSTGEAPGTPLAEATAPAGRSADLRRAGLALRGLLRAAGPGRHHLVCSVPAEEGPLVAVLHADVREDRAIRADRARTLQFRTVLAAALAPHGVGGVVMRSAPADGGGPAERVRGWSLRGGWLRPLTEAEVFAAYCTDPTSGDPLPPEPGVCYQAGTPIPLPEDDG